MYVISKPKISQTLLKSKFGAKLLNDSTPCFFGQATQQKKSLRGDYKSRLIISIL